MNFRCPSQISGDVPLAELGLAGWTPPGFIQWGLEMIHVDIGLPWWGSVVLGKTVDHTILAHKLIPFRYNSESSHVHGQLCVIVCTVKSKVVSCNTKAFRWL